MRCGLLQTERDENCWKRHQAIYMHIYIYIYMIAQDSSLRIVVPASRVRQLELSVVSQALFGVFDLEREGQVPQDSVRR